MLQITEMVSKNSLRNQIENDLQNK
jgi:hypothetical protein